MNFCFNFSQKFLVGSRRTPKFFMNPILIYFINMTYGPTGKQLMLEDDDNLPLLVQMTLPGKNFST